MATCIKLDSRLKSDLSANIVGGESRGVGGEGVVEVRNVGLVVLRVVQCHDLAGEMRFQSLHDETLEMKASRLSK